MNVKLFCATGLCAFLFLLTGAEKKSDFELRVMEKTVPSFSKMKLQVQPEVADSYEMKAWRVIAYLPNVPPEFPEQTGFKINPHKQKEWSTVQIMDWNWKIPQTGILELSTDKWPAGDYGLVLYVLFQGKDKNKKLPPLYLNRTFHVTVVSK